MSDSVTTPMNTGEACAVCGRPATWAFRVMGVSPKRSARYPTCDEHGEFYRRQGDRIYPSERLSHDTTDPSPTTPHPGGPPMTTATASRPDTACQECGWVCPSSQYHPIVACWIVKQTGADPLPYLRGIAADMEHVDENGVYHSILQRLEEALA